MTHLFSQRQSKNSDCEVHLRFKVFTSFHIKNQSLNMLMSCDCALRTLTLSWCEMSILIKHVQLIQLTLYCKTSLYCLLNSFTASLIATVFWSVESIFINLPFAKSLYNDKIWLKKWWWWKKVSLYIIAEKKHPKHSLW